MRLIALLVTAWLTMPAAFAQQVERPSQPTDASPQVDSRPLTIDGQESTDKQAPEKKPPEPSLNLPVSVNRIRQALAQPAEPLKGLKGLDETPTFRVEIRERLKIEELLQSLNLKSGPPVPGGLYGYEQQRQLFPSVDNPLAQPYAAFNQGELLTVLVENLVGRYLAGRAINSITAAERAHAEATAKEEVGQAVAQYCAAQPNHG